MSKPGPRSTPTALRVLKGETRPSRLNEREPHPRAGNPRIPKWLTPDERSIWRQELRELRPMGVVTPADATALGLLTAAIARYAQAKALVDRDGLVIPGRGGGPVTNPASREERLRWADVLRACGEFGLTPSARTGLVVAGETSSELEQLLS